MGRRISRSYPFNRLLELQHKEQQTQEQVPLRFNTELTVLELYNGTAWLPVGVQTV